MKKSRREKEKLPAEDKTKARGKAAPSTSGHHKDDKGARLEGKVVFLDIKDIQQSNLLKLKLEKLCAVVETFLTKDVHYVVSSSESIKSGSRSRSDSPAFANTPSPFSVTPTGATPSPTYVNAEGKLVPLSRGQAMAQMARARNRSPSPTSAVASARRLGIKVIAVEVADRWLDRELKKHNLTISEKPSPSKVTPDKKRESFGRIRHLVEPFLKMESNCKRHRPLVKQMQAWPHINLGTASGTCPFDGVGVATQHRSKGVSKEAAASAGHLASPPTQSTTQRRSLEGDESSRLVGVPILTTGDIRRQQEKRRLEQRRRGYCECCEVKYDDIEEHVKEPRHMEFARDKNNYEGLEELISVLPSPSQFLHNTLLRHCARQVADKPAATIGQVADDESSNDQVLMLHVTSPCKPSQRAPDYVEQQLRHEAPGFHTPTHTPQYAAGKDPLQNTAAGQQYATGASEDKPNSQATLDHSLTADGEHKAKDPSKLSGPLPAVVKRRPGARSAYGSPREKWSQGLSPVRRDSPCTPKKVRERSMIFGNTSIGSLQSMPEDSPVTQPSECSKKVGRERASVEPQDQDRLLHVTQSDSQNKQTTGSSSSSFRQLSGSHSEGKETLPTPVTENTSCISPAKSSSLKRKRTSTTTSDMNEAADSQTLSTTTKQAVKSQDHGAVSNCSTRDKETDIKHASACISTLDNKVQHTTIDLESHKESKKSKTDSRRLRCRKNTDQEGAETESKPLTRKQLFSSASNTASPHKKHSQQHKPASEVDRVPDSSSQERPVDCKESPLPTTWQSPRKRSRETFSTEQSVHNKPSNKYQSSEVDVVPDTASRHQPKLSDTNLLQTPKKSKLQGASHIIEAEDACSSPVYLPEDVTTSTPVLVVVRKLRSTESGIYSAKQTNTPTAKSSRRVLMANEAAQPENLSENDKSLSEKAENLSSTSQKSAPRSKDRPLSRSKERSKKTTEKSPTKQDGASSKHKTSTSKKEVSDAGNKEESPKSTDDSVFQDSVDDGEEKTRRRSNRNKKSEHSSSKEFPREEEKVGSYKKSSTDGVSLQSNELSVTNNCGQVGDKNNDNRELKIKLVRSGFSTPPQTYTKKVKLDRSWHLLSDHSMSRLLRSDTEISTFEGFQGDEKLPSDLSYISASEIELTDDEDREWLVDGEGSSDFDEDERNVSLRDFIPTFSSPGKSDSSWGDACDLYLNQTVEQQLKSKQPLSRSPRKISSVLRKKRKRSGSGMCNSGKISKKRKTDKQMGNSEQSGLRTPTKGYKTIRRHHSSRTSEQIMHVDEEVLFNYASPQKNKLKMSPSPLKLWNGNLKESVHQSPKQSVRTRHSCLLPSALPPPFKI